MIKESHIKCISSLYLDIGNSYIELLVNKGRVLIIVQIDSKAMYELAAAATTTA